MNGLRVFVFLPFTGIRQAFSPRLPVAESITGKNHSEISERRPRKSFDKQLVRETQELKWAPPAGNGF
ncbi:MAG TPA: hypothetical protein VG738_02235 [Chitinophagaceae bacterium]|nr:hypothetical protein [Chitinophagaceae bacterium]